MGAKLRIRTLLLGVTLILPSALGADCDRGYKLEDEPCAPGKQEIYKDVHNAPGYLPQYNRVCCKPGTDQYKTFTSHATSCRATECSTVSATNICSTLGPRYVNGSKLKYDEIMRDPCTTQDGEKGTTGLCCVEGSSEGVLMTTMGAEINEFPHQAKLYLPGNCGGTVYNKRWIITAAHCIVDKETGKVKSAKKMRAIIGTNNADNEDPQYEYKIKRAISYEEYSKLRTHPNYEEAKKRTLNDIALLETERDIVFSDKIKALEIAPKGFDPFKYSDKAVIVGWGTTDTLDLSAHLQKANFVLRTDKACKKAWGGHLKGVEDTKLCVGGVMDGVWSPTAGGGDSGGPAICRKANGHPVLCGVTSYGGDDEKCLKNGDAASCPPSVYAEVAHFHDWIKKHAGEQDPKTFYQPYLYGKEVKKGMYDHQVHITSDSGKSCGGTLIAPDYVLTAQQCVIKPDGKTSHSNIQVHTGIKDLSGEGKTFEVRGLVPLSGFKMIGNPVNVKAQGNRVIITDNMYANDLALVKLDGKAKISPDKIPQLPEIGEGYSEGVELAFPRNTTLGGKLLSRDYRLLDQNDCQRRMDRLAKTKLGGIKVKKNVLCGVEKYSGGSTCDRELGGGLLCKAENGKDVLCGVQIFRLCEMTIPNGFLNMAYYGQWVTDAMQAGKKF